MNGLALLLLAVDVLGPSKPAACAAERVEPLCRRAATIWCGRDATVPIEDLALHAAPILWFSPDEPLLREGRPIPQELAYDLRPAGRAKGTRRVVYWQVEKLLADDQDRKETADLIAKGLLPVAKVDRLTISFFFYYERDLGLNPHYHDLEGVEFLLNVEAPEAKGSGASRDEGLRRVYVGRVTGLGHGSGLVSNILQIKPSIRSPGGAMDVTMPVTILVEEGKHASCPDRNGDGVYTPGYDVNIRVPDAWGLRDVFGTGVLASQYQPWMSKSRSPHHRLAVDASRFGPTDSFSPARCYQNVRDLPYPAGPGQSYELRRVPRCAECSGPLADRAFCDAVCERDDWKRIVDGPELPKAACLEDSEKAGRMSCKELDIERRVHQAFAKRPQIEFASRGSALSRGVGGLKYKYGAAWPVQFLRQSLAPSVRFDARDFGLGLSFYSPYGFPKFAGWPAARFGWIREDGAFHGRFDLSYTASIARLSDAYVAVGYDWGLERQHLEKAEAEPGDPVDASPLEVRSRREDSWALEGGIQVRYRAVGVRVGVRGSVAGGSIDSWRVVGELTYGPKPDHAKVH